MLLGNMRFFADFQEARQVGLIVGCVVGIAAMSPPQLRAQAPSNNQPASCSDSNVSSGQNVCFDGTAGTFYGSHRFLRRDTVRVWVCNLQDGANYQVKVDETAVAETALNNLAGPFAAVAPPKCTQVATVLSDSFTARTDVLTPQIEKMGVATFTNLGQPVTLTMGQPVFALSLGFAGTPLGKKSFQTLGAPSGSSTGSVIGLQENSSSRIQPMGFINASLLETRAWCCSLHLTAGFTITNNKISTNPEYLFGPSIGMVKEQLFITAGAYGGYQGSLQSPYQVGGPAPTGAIPTLNQLHWKLGFAISWRVTSFGSSSNKSSTAGQTATATGNKQQ